MLKTIKHGSYRQYTHKKSSMLSPMCICLKCATCLSWRRERVGYLFVFLEQRQPGEGSLAKVARVRCGNGRVGGQGSVGVADGTVGVAGLVRLVHGRHGVSVGRRHAVPHLTISGCGSGSNCINTKTRFENSLKLTATTVFFPQEIHPKQ